jgi:hypothetical protein
MVQKYCGRWDGGKTENPPVKSRRQEGYCGEILGAKVNNKFVFVLVQDDLVNVGREISVAYCGHINSATLHFVKKGLVVYGTHRCPGTGAYGLVELFNQTLGRCSAELGCELGIKRLFHN